MNKFFAIAAVIVAIAMAAGAQQAMQPNPPHYSYPAQGKGTTYHTGANGASAGRSVTTGNGTTYHYGANGASAGRSTTSGNTTYHYNANGSLAGRSVTSGNTTYHYDAKGRLVGTSRAPSGGKH